MTRQQQADELLSAFQAWRKRREEAEAFHRLEVAKADGHRAIEFALAADEYAQAVREAAAKSVQS